MKPNKYLAEKIINKYKLRQIIKPVGHQRVFKKTQKAPREKKQITLKRNNHNSESPETVKYFKWPEGK